MAARVDMKSIDPLTGLLNRFGCIKAVEKFITTGQTNSLAIIWIDLDRFKKINESFCHLGGDDVITNLAVRLRRISGRAEISRMSGD